MAGRGTDIILGGNPKPQISAVKADASLSEDQKQQKIDQITNEWKDLNQKVLDAGGLYIIGTERHESRRIDNQLRGRSGRQGDNGASRFYLSLDDSLLRIFGGERMRGMMSRLGMKQGESIEHRLLSRSIESAQRKVEGYNFDIRKQLLDYDDVSNDQRKVIYAQRDEVLSSDDLSPITLNMIQGIIGETFDNYIPPKSMDDAWDVKGLEKALRDEFHIGFDVASKIAADPNIDEQIIREELVEYALNAYRNKLENFRARIALEVNQFIDSMLPENRENWNLPALDGFVYQNGGNTEFSFAEKYAGVDISKEEFLAEFSKVSEKVINSQVTRFERGVLLQHLDHYWREHLTQLEHLRQGIGLRGYAQKDPKQEYKQESFNLFSQMLDGIKHDVVKVLFNVQLQGMDDVPNEDSIYDEAPNNTNENLAFKEPQFADGNNAPISRNSPCPCGSGEKYKHCHGKLA